MRATSELALIQTPPETNIRYAGMLYAKDCKVCNNPNALELFARRTSHLLLHPSDPLLCVRTLQILIPSRCHNNSAYCHIQFITLPVTPPLTPVLSSCASTRCCTEARAHLGSNRSGEARPLQLVEGQKPPRTWRGLQKTKWNMKLHGLD